MMPVIGLRMISVSLKTERRNSGSDH